jgi:chemotaxis protein MotA
MDIATLVGLLGSFGIVLLAMLIGGSGMMFLDTPAVLIVFGGTAFTVLTKFTLAQVVGAFRVAFKAFAIEQAPPEALIDEVVKLADAARKGGLLALEGRKVGSEFLAKGIDLLVDGHDPEVVRQVLTSDMAQAQQRHEWGARIFKAIGDVGPAMGMIGTLVGLVAMLANMEDPKSIGPAMSIALLTTLYGAILANLFALPIADKLELRRIEEGRAKALIIDALLAIQNGQNPRVIGTMLQSYLPESQRRPLR